MDIKVLEKTLVHLMTIIGKLNNDESISSGDVERLSQSVINLNAEIVKYKTSDDSWYLDSKSEQEENDNWEFSENVEFPDSWGDSWE